MSLCCHTLHTYGCSRLSPGDDQLSQSPSSPLAAAGLSLRFPHSYSHLRPLNTEQHVPGGASSSSSNNKPHSGSSSLCQPAAVAEGAGAAGLQDQGFGSMVLMTPEDGLRKAEAAAEQQHLESSSSSAALPQPPLQLTPGEAEDAAQAAAADVVGVVNGCAAVWRVAGRVVTPALAGRPGMHLLYLCRPVFACCFLPCCFVMQHKLCSS